MARCSHWLGRAVVITGLACACVTDHKSLAKRPNTSSGGAGGSVGTGGSGGGFPVLGGAGGQNNGTGGKVEEPPGDNVFTFVHGVVDAIRVQVCFARVTADGSAAFGSPLPDVPLAFGGVLPLASIGAADLTSDALEPFVITGDLELIAGLDCAAAIDRARLEEALATDGGTGDAGDASGPDVGAGGTSGATGVSGAAGTPTLGEAGAGASGAGGAAGSNGDAGAGGEAGTGDGPTLTPPRLRVRELPVIPPGTLAGGRSTLLVATGCMGGAAFKNSQAETYCGTGYSPETPTLAPIFVVLSRTSSAVSMGLQVIHASRATQQIDVLDQAPADLTLTTLSLVTRLEQGQIAPKPALLDYSRERYAVDNPDYQVSVSLNGSGVLGEPWSDIIARGGLADVSDGQNYALVILGPRLDLRQLPPLWNRPVITIVAAAPQF